MFTNEEKERYSRQTILAEIGVEGQERLKAARVMVVGAGGLGCPVLQYLVAAGVGAIGIADGDIVSLSNLQRQILYTANDIGKGKAATAAEKLSALNPNVRIQVFPVFIDAANVLAIFNDYDLVVDGSDNFATRYLVNDACVIQGKPMVSGAIYKYEGQVSVFNYQNGPTYRCLFPEPPGAGESPNCADIGVLATLPGIIGSIQANEVIKIITGIGAVLSGRLLVIDTLTMNSHSFKFNAIEANKNIKTLEATTTEQCSVPVAQLDYDELLQLLNDSADIQLVDVREMEEHYSGNIGGVNVPMSTLDRGYSLLDPLKRTILYCASGVRSARSANILIQKGFNNVSSLKGGIKHLV
jgi:sulfur-carrier protein adenylyltransferase/sulfurtransferase